MKSTLPETSVEHIERILAGRERLLDYIDGLALLSADSMKTRHHGDFHLGQVLIAQDDVIIIDFEGEPSRSHRREAGQDIAAARCGRHAALV